MVNKNKIISEGLTFDDVLVIPAFSEVIPNQVDTTSKFSRNINLKSPFISAAMDTVTEAKMAISMAQEGGIGVLHKNLSIENQVHEVNKVKRSQSGMILDPIILKDKALVSDALKIMKEKSIGGIPIIDDNGCLTGILTNRDLRFETNISKPVSDLMTKKVITIDFKNIDSAESVLKKNKIEKLPVVDSTNRLKGLITYKDIIKSQNKPYSSKDSFGRLVVAAAIGVSDDSMERASNLVNAGLDALVIDTAHAHSLNVFKLVKTMRSKFDIDIVVGNIATAEAAKELENLKIDGIKVGIGPGSICTTRVIAGIGVPQLSAIMQVSNSIKDKSIGLIADGGIRYSGDIVKAVVAGADSVMLGSLLSGTEEAPGEVIIFQGRKFKTYRGMGSVEAMQAGSKDRYFQDFEKDAKKLVPEGIVGRVAYKGSVSEVIHQMSGGLKAGMGYSGSKNIETLKKSKFIKISSSSIIENHPHDVNIIREAPNYSRK
tara:strand:+ start:383 stop:1843 length:1461 start_codon:yes stop_codon:yes gene_type:complete